MDTNSMNGIKKKVYNILSIWKTMLSTQGQLSDVLF